MTEPSRVVLVSDSARPPAVSLPPKQPKDMDAPVDHLTFSMSNLLDPKTWNLPGWDQSNALSTQISATQTTETIDRLDMSIALLSRYRNSLRPLHRLSPDILMLIFAELENDHWDPFAERFGDYSWMVAARVCHSWRELILGTPICWRQLSTRFPSAALAALERSGDSGICLAIPEDTFSNDALKDKAIAVIEGVAKQMHRLRWLYVRSDIIKTETNQINYLLQPLVNLEAPMLEHFITRKKRRNGTAIALPTLFGGHTPQLYRLRVHHLYPQLNSLSLSRLRHLTFCGRKHSPISLGISDLLDILERTPSLGVLDVKKILWQPAAEDDKRKVQLDNLKFLNMGRDNASTLADIIDRLIIPECAIKLEVWFNRYEDNKFHVGVPMEHLLSVDHPLRNIKRLRLQFMSSYEGVVIKGQFKEMPFEIQGLLEAETVANLGDMDAIAGTVFQSIVRTFDLEHLEEFSMLENHSNTRWTTFGKKVWLELFRRLPNLKALSVFTDPSYDEGFWRSILAALAEPDIRSGNHVCPALERLTVSGDKTWSSLRCYILAQSRSQAGHPFKHVSMALSHYASFDDPEDTDLSLLREYIETVDLNPVEPTFPDWPDSS
ncbi:hypothetical protein BDW22DRAFT_1354256 [Trametopsis cervina]|nr:hypothetical protein BDW22DRAFT_1354256 [Trametopsis cervina]